MILFWDYFTYAVPKTTSEIDVEKIKYLSGQSVLHTFYLSCHIVLYFTNKLVNDCK